MATIKTTGTNLVVDNGNGTNTDITIGEVISVTGLGSGTNTEIDVTDLASTAKEFRIGLTDNGTASMELNFDPDDVGQDELIAMRDAQESREFTLTLPEGTDLTGTFTAFVTSFSIDINTDDVCRGTVTLRLTGSLTFA